VELLAPGAFRSLSLIVSFCSLSVSQGTVEATVKLPAMPACVRRFFCRDTAASLYRRTLLMSLSAAFYDDSPPLVVIHYMIFSCRFLRRMCSRQQGLACLLCISCSERQGGIEDVVRFLAPDRRIDFCQKFCSRMDRLARCIKVKGVLILLERNLFMLLVFYFLNVSSLRSTLAHLPLRHRARRWPSLFRLPPRAPERSTAWNAPTWHFRERCQCSLPADPEAIRA